MFRNKMIAITALLLPPLFFFVYEIVVVHTGDIERYEELVKERRIASSRTQAPTNQQRKGVCKDIWFTQDNASRLHYQISSEDSLLTLTPIKNKFEIVEVLSGIKCWMQDKLYEESPDERPMQQIRYIEADEGQYCFTSQQFLANGVMLSLFRLPGHELPKQELAPDEAIMRGIAHSISFVFNEKAPQFQARNFQATMVKE